METFSGFLGTSVQEPGWGRPRQLCPVWPVAAQGPCKPASVTERNALGPPHPPGQGCPCPWSSPGPQARQAGWQSSDHVLAPGEPPPLMQPEGWGAGTAQGRVGVKSLRSGQGLAGRCRAAGRPSVSSLAAHPSLWWARGPAHLPRPPGGLLGWPFPHRTLALVLVAEAGWVSTKPVPFPQGAAPAAVRRGHRPESRPGDRRGTMTQALQSWPTNISLPQSPLGRLTELKMLRWGSREEPQDTGGGAVGGATAPHDRPQHPHQET